MRRNALASAGYPWPPATSVQFCTTTLRRPGSSRAVGDRTVSPGLITLSDIEEVASIVDTSLRTRRAVFNMRQPTRHKEVYARCVKVASCIPKERYECRSYHR